AEPRLADAADRSADLSVLRAGDGQRPGLEGLDRGGIRRRYYVGDRLRSDHGASTRSERRSGENLDVREIPAVQILRRDRQYADIRLQGGIGLRGCAPARDDLPLISRASGNSEQAARLTSKTQVAAFAGTRTCPIPPTNAYCRGDGSW